jgi:hypothetical protein
MGERLMTYEPHYEGSPVVHGPPGAVSSAHGAHSYAARAGHHLAPRPLSAGRDLFAELGAGFALLAFDADPAPFLDAARGLGVPLTAVRDSFDGGREAFAARLVLVRPDQYVAWTGDRAPADAAAVLMKAVGRA